MPCRSPVKTADVNKDVEGDYLNMEDRWDQLRKLASEPRKLPKNAKVTPEMVQTMREMRKAGFKTSLIARVFPEISDRQVRGIVAGTAWKK